MKEPKIFFKTKINIGSYSISQTSKPMVIAEISANHNGSIELAKKTMLQAKKNGADAIKLQTYEADTITIDCDKKDFQISEGPWAGYRLYDLYKEAETPFKWHAELFKYAHEIGLICFSTPFDESAVDLLESLEAPAYKIASFEAIDIPLIKYAASTMKPIIISTGIANLDEITEAVEAVKSVNNPNLILLHCISSYPAPIEQSNIHTMVDLSNRFNLLAGLSDHTIGNTASIVATSLGAAVIEKHFIVDRTLGGPDAHFSMEPNDLSALVRDVDLANQSLGSPGYEIKDAEIGNAVFRRSIYFVKAIKKGEIITEKHIRRIRPGFGVAPKHFPEILGKKAKNDRAFGDPVRFVDFN
jgi:pseudaminic acid synthase